MRTERFAFDNGWNGKSVERKKKRRKQNPIIGFTVKDLKFNCYRIKNQTDAACWFVLFSVFVASSISVCLLFFLFFFLLHSGVGAESPFETCRPLFRAFSPIDFPYELAIRLDYSRAKSIDARDFTSQSLNFHRVFFFFESRQSLLQRICRLFSNPFDAIVNINAKLWRLTCIGVQCMRRPMEMLTHVAETSIEQSTGNDFNRNENPCG